MANKEKPAAAAAPALTVWKPADFSDAVATIKRDPAAVRAILLSARKKGKSSLPCPAPAGDAKRKYRLTLAGGKPTLEGEDTPGVWHPVALPE